MESIRKKPTAPPVVVPAALEPVHPVPLIVVMPVKAPETLKTTLPILISWPLGAVLTSSERFVYVKVAAVPATTAPVNFLNAPVGSDTSATFDDATTVTDSIAEGALKANVAAVLLDWAELKIVRLPTDVVAASVTSTLLVTAETSKMVDSTLMLTTSDGIKAELVTRKLAVVKPVGLPTIVAKAVPPVVFKVGAVLENFAPPPRVIWSVSLVFSDSPVPSV